MHETLEEQGGETACSETTGLLGGRESLCVQSTCVVPFPAAGVRKQQREGRRIAPGSFLDYCYLKKHQVHPLPSSLNLHFSLPSSLNFFWISFISFLLLQRYVLLLDGTHCSSPAETSASCLPLLLQLQAAQGAVFTISPSRALLCGSTC